MTESCTRYLTLSPLRNALLREHKHRQGWTTCLVDISKRQCSLLKYVTDMTLYLRHITNGAGVGFGWHSGQRVGLGTSNRWAQICIAPLTLLVLQNGVIKGFVCPTVSATHWARVQSTGPVIHWAREQSVGPVIHWVR